MEVGGWEGLADVQRRRRIWYADVVGGWVPFGEGHKSNVHASPAYSRKEALFGWERDSRAWLERCLPYFSLSVRHRPGKHRGCVRTGHGVCGEMHVAGGHCAARLGHGARARVT